MRKGLASEVPTSSPEKSIDSSGSVSPSLTPSPEPVRKPESAVKPKKGPVHSTPEPRKELKFDKETMKWTFVKVEDLELF